MIRTGTYFALLSLIVASSLSITAKTGVQNRARLNQIKIRSVHLRVVKNIYDQDKPWLPPEIKIEYGSGYYLGKGRILTDLELTRYAHNIEARFYSDSTIYKPFIQHQGYDIGLAMLKFKVPKKINPDIETKKDTDSSKDDTKKPIPFNKNEKRKLKLKLLKKSNSDIPFIQIEDPQIDKEQKIQEQKNEIQVVNLAPLPFSMLSSVTGDDFSLATLTRRKDTRIYNIKFEREKFQRLENSLIDYHWLYSVSRLSIDLLPQFSGSPVIYNNKIIGIFHAKSKQRGYVIPAGVIRSFLDDIADGRYDGLKHSGLLYRKIINPARKKYLGLKENEGGLEVYYLAIGNQISRKIHKGDIILQLDQQPLDQEGFIYINKIKWNVEEYLRSRMRIKQKVQVMILRSNKRFIVNLVLSENSIEHPGRLSLTGAVQWYMSSGLVFENLNYQKAHFLKGKYKNDLYLQYQELVRSGFSQQRNAIILSNRFPIKENTGSEKFLNSVVQSINDRRVYSLVELANEWKRTRTNFVVIEFYNRDDKLILPFARHLHSSRKVEKIYKIQENGRVY